MPRKKGIPAYCLHKASGRGVARVDGHDYYFGPYEDLESQERYRRFIAEWLVDRGRSTSSANEKRLVSINEVLLAYWEFAQSCYATNGSPSSELSCMRCALRPVRELYGHARADEFGPKSLRAVQQLMIDRGLSRRTINGRVSRIRRFFKWAVAEELIPASVHHGLEAVAGLRSGRTEARETEPIRPAAEGAIEALLPFVSPQVAAMIQVQALTGMRPGEVVIMRACDIDTSEDVWIYDVPQHKNLHRGHDRPVFLGPRAQAILRPFLGRAPSEYLFSPRESEAWRRERRPVHCKPERKTPAYPSELKAREKAKQTRRQQLRKRCPREHYDTDTYRRAIEYGFRKARKSGIEIPHWHPNQLRHSRATEIRKEYGVEAAQVTLGHARADVTQVYAERNQKLARRIARETG